MKISRFNVEIEEQDSLIIYNTLSGGILKIEDKYAKEYKQLKSKQEVCLDKELLQNLKRANMVVDEEIDEIGMLKIMHTSLTHALDNYSLSIAPTMKCNFICPYCYEKGRNLYTMSREVVDLVKKYFVQLKETAKHFGIAWYGGEPLLAFDIIKELSECAIELFGDNYSATMVTNGYNLTKNIVETFKSLKITALQVTIDGPPDIHNQMRKMPNGEDTFFVILKNMKEALEIDPELRITIRVNTDKTNIERTDEIIQYLEEYDLIHKVGMYLAPIDNINGTCDAESNCFTNSEFAKEQINFIKRNIKYSDIFINIPRCNMYICGAVAANSYVIDPLGNIYKCWDDISNKKHCIGNIKDGISYSKEYTKWILYDPFESSECSNCCFLPLCMGGCPNHFIKDKKHKCLPIKENVKEFVELLDKTRKREAK